MSLLCRCRCLGLQVCGHACQQQGAGGPVVERLLDPYVAGVAADALAIAETEESNSHGWAQSLQHFNIAIL